MCVWSISNNLDDVRDQWERIKLSYEILRDPRTRKRYDRHEVLADPAAAMGRAVTDAALDLVGNSLSKVGAGIFAVSAFALEQMVSSGRSKNGTMEM
jgi:DnaJ-class molecular chaperone